jgi:NAD(P)-dependent dehydrogenase (short-subunit alcohol dehydrogenase family)
VRTALITGGTGGLGTAVTERLLKTGWRCVVPYRNAAGAQRLREVLGEREGIERLSLVAGDMFDQADVTRVVQLAEDEQAPVGALVNLLGGFDAPGFVHETPVARFEEQLRMNLRASYLACAACLPGMLKRGNGAIVCVSSRAAVSPFAGAAGYITSKGALLTFVEALAVECAGSGVRVNAVLPSVIDTPANRGSQPEADYSLWVSPGEIAETIDFLCSPRASAISGARIPVYGSA